jgi:hypothetical protein
MKPLPFLLTACLLAGASTVAAFEGTITMTLTAGKMSRPVVYYFKGDNLRFESTPEKGPTTVGLLDAKTGNMDVLMVEQKMYMRVGAPKKRGSPDATIEATGRSEEIAGYTCTEYIVHDKKNIIEVWGTTDLGKMPNLAEAFGNRGRRSAWEIFAAEREIFALRVVTKNSKGKETSRLECTAVEAKSLDENLFLVPADFTQLKMPGLGDLLLP